MSPYFFGFHYIFNFNIRGDLSANIYIFFLVAWETTPNYEKNKKLYL